MSASDGLSRVSSLVPSLAQEEAQKSSHHLFSSAAKEVLDHAKVIVQERCVCRLQRWEMFQVRCVVPGVCVHLLVLARFLELALVCTGTSPSSVSSLSC